MRSSQNLEEKKVLLRIKDVLLGHAETVRSATKEIGLENRFVMPLDDQLVVQIEWAAHDVWLNWQEAENMPFTFPCRDQQAVSTPSTDAGHSIPA